MEIDYGLKVFSNKTELIGKMNELYRKGSISYIELYYLFGTEISEFLKCEMPVVLHCDHTENGLNIGDNGNKRFYLLKKLLEAADSLDAENVIVHAGFGNKENAVSFLNKTDDSRILIENMPKIGINNESMLGFDAKEIKSLTENKFSTCLDFSHAARASVSLKRDYKKMVEELLGLKPIVFHLSDSDLKEEKDNHLRLGEGELDLGFIKRCIGKNKSRRVTIETPKHNFESFQEDLESISHLRSVR